MLKVVVCKNQKLRLDSYTYDLAKRLNLLTGITEHEDNSLRDYPFVLTGSFSDLMRLLYQLTLEGEVRLI